MAALEARSLGFQTEQRSRQIEAYARDAKSALESARSNIEAAAVAKEEIQARLKRLEAAVTDARSRLARSTAAITAAPDLVTSAQAELLAVFGAGAGGIAKLVEGQTATGDSLSDPASVYSLLAPTAFDIDLRQTWPPLDLKVDPATVAAGSAVSHEAATACVCRSLADRTSAATEHTAAASKATGEASAASAAALAQVLAAQGELRSAVEDARAARREAMQSQTELGPALATLDAARKKRDGAVAAVARAGAEGRPFARQLIKVARILTPAGTAAAMAIGAKEPDVQFQEAGRILAALDDAPVTDSEGAAVAAPLDLSTCLASAWDATCRSLEDKAQWVCDRALPQSVRDVSVAASRLVRAREQATVAEQGLSSKAASARRRLADLALRCDAAPHVQALVEGAATRVIPLESDDEALRPASAAIREATLAASSAIREESSRLASEADQVEGASAKLRAQIAAAETTLMASKTQLRAAQLAAEGAQATASEQKASQHQSLVQAATETLRRSWAAAARARSHAPASGAHATRAPPAAAVNAVAGFAVAAAAKALDEGRGAGPPGGEAGGTLAERLPAEGSLHLLARSPEQAADLTETARALDASVAALTTGEAGAPQPSNVADMLLHLIESLARGDLVPADVGDASAELRTAIDAVLAIPDATRAIRSAHEKAAGEAKRAAERAAADCERLVALLDGAQRDASGRAQR